MFENASNEYDPSSSSIFQSAKAVGSCLLQWAATLGLSYYPPTPEAVDSSGVTGREVARFRELCNNDRFDIELRAWLKD